jgi:RNA polymerase subunit RPABC4/transcription elongation factor Spt4
MDFLILAGILGLIPAAIAHRKGRGFVGWWIFGTLLFIVALPAALLAGKDEAVLEGRAMRDGSMKKCPHCAELVKSDARVCRYCGGDVSAVAPRTHSHISCPSCNGPVDASMTHCPSCRARLA